MNTQTQPQTKVNKKNMTPSDKYKSCTEQGCRQSLESINGLDDKVTIGELRKYLEARMNDAKEEFESAKTKLIKEVEGKYFRIVYEKDHIVVLKIDKVDVVNQYGEVDAKITGESVSEYKGQIRYETFSDKWYSNYFSNNYAYAHDEKSFNELKEQIQNIKI